MQNLTCPLDSSVTIRDAMTLIVLEEQSSGSATRSTPDADDEVSFTGYANKSRYFNTLADVNGIAFISIVIQNDTKAITIQIYKPHYRALNFLKL